jgi:hypothetical protein
MSLSVSIESQPASQSLFVFVAALHNSLQRISGEQFVCASVFMVMLWSSQCAAVTLSAPVAEVLCRQSHLDIGLFQQITPQHLGLVFVAGVDTSVMTIADDQDSST